MITEAEQSHHLPSASWGPRKAGAGVPAQVQKLAGEERATGVSSSSRAGGTDIQYGR